jgi:hypothetical protein
MATNPFVFIESVSSSKRHLMTDEEEERAYVPFLTNRNLSYFPDTIGDANRMNQLGHVPKRLQYDYYFYALRPRKRFAGKWAKPAKSVDLEAIRERYQCNYSRANEMLSLLTPQQLEAIHAALEKGGK